jgi:hypothetical protein
MFSGKRPFGYSGWAWELHTALADAGLVEATLDDDGNLDTMTRGQEERADALIFAAVKALR